MDIDRFTEAQWREILEEFRLLVQRAGFADWDVAMAASLEEGSDREARFSEIGSMIDEPAHYQLRLYTKEFVRYLKSRSREMLDERRRSLGRLLQTAEGAPIKDFTVVIDGRERSLYERADQIEAMIEDLNQFQSEISGESTDFWIDGDGPDDRDGER